MKEGIYGMWYEGNADTGMGIICLETGKIVGVDIGGVKYDGDYNFNQSTNMIDCN